MIGPDAPERMALSLKAAQAEIAALIAADPQAALGRAEAILKHADYHQTWPTTEAF